MRTKSWLLAAVILILAGALIGGASFAAMGYDFKEMNTADYTTFDFDIKDAFQNITINADVEDVVFTSSEDGSCRIECYADKKERYQVGVKEDTLVLEKEHFIHIHMGLVLESPKITVYLPKDEYASLLVKTDTGDVEIPGNFSFDTANISTDTGTIDLSSVIKKDLTVKTDSGSVIPCDLTADNITVTTQTGDVVMKNVTTAGKLSIDTDTGDVVLEACDAEEISIKTDTGDVTGTFLTEKAVSAKSDTGDIDVPKNTTGGKCEICTDTGDISIKICE